MWANIIFDFNIIIIPYMMMIIIYEMASGLMWVNIIFDYYNIIIL